MIADFIAVHGVTPHDFACPETNSAPGQTIRRANTSLPSWSPFQPWRLQYRTPRPLGNRQPMLTTATPRPDGGARSASIARLIRAHTSCPSSWSRSGRLISWRQEPSGGASMAPRRSRSSPRLQELILELTPIAVVDKRRRRVRAGVFPPCNLGSVRSCGRPISF